MSRTGSDEVIELFYVETIADKSAPTDDEINAGTRLTPWLLPDGLARPQSGNTIDTSDASSKYNKREAGSYGGDNLAATLFRDDDVDEDDAWATLPRGTRGNLVVFPFGTSGVDHAAAAGDRVEVWPGVVLSRAAADIGRDTAQKFMVEWTVNEDPDDDSVVVASS